MSLRTLQVSIDGGPPIDIGLGIPAVVTGRSPNTTYGSVRIREKDATGNVSAWLEVGPVTTTDAPPLDVITTGTVVAGYGLRKLRTAYSGPCIRIERSTDNTQLDIGFAGDDVDVAAAVAFIGGGTGKVVTWYDQKSGGTAYDISAPFANAPTFLAMSSENGKAGIDWGSTADNHIYLGSAASVSVTAPKIFAAMRMNASAGFQIWFDFGTNKFRGGKVFPIPQLYNGTQVDFSFPNPSDLDYLNFAQQSRRSSFFAGNDKMYLNGVELTNSPPGNAGDTAASGVAFTLGNGGGHANGFVGVYSEVIIVDGAITDPDSLVIDNSQKGWYKDVSPIVPVNFKIDCGRMAGGWLHGFYQDTYFTNGNLEIVGDTVDVSGVANAADPSVYATQRFFGSFVPEYVLQTPNIVPLKWYLIRGHFNEHNDSHVPGRSVMRLIVNGVDTTFRGQGEWGNPFFEPYFQAPGTHRALVLDFLAQADNTGKLDIKCSGCLNNSGEDVRIAALEIHEAPPIASGTATPGANQTAPVVFTDTSINSPTSWLWTFGDGNTSTLQNPTHTYAAAGPYTVTLVASNAFGDSDAFTIAVNVPSASVLTVTPSSLPDATNGGFVPYSQAISATGGTGPYTATLVVEASDARDYTDISGSNWFEISRRGALPNGLSLASNLLSGTPNLSAVKPSLIVLEGDSIIRGSTTNFPNYDSPYTPAAHLAKLLPRSWRVISVATGGETFAMMDSEYSTQVAPYYNASYEFCVAFLSSGHNDILGGTSLATMKANTQSWISAAKATGFKTICATIVPDPYYLGADATKLTDYNTWVKRTLTDVDHVLDWTDNPLLANQQNNRYFDQGGIHNTELGYMQRAVSIKAAIDALSPSGSGAISVDYKFAIKVIDSLGNAATKQFTLTVQP